MPLPSSGIIVVEKPSSASITKINNSASSITNNFSNRPLQDQTGQQTQIQYYEYYDVHGNQISERQQQQQKQYRQQQQQQHSTIVVDATIFHQQQQQQQQLQLGGSSGVVIGRKIHSSSSTSSSSSVTSTSSLCSPTSTTTLLNKTNLQIQTLKAVPMPQTKQFSQQQQIIQHTSHSTTTTGTTANPQHHLLQSPQHVQQINLAASSIHHQSQHHHSQQQPPPTTHMIQVSEDFLEKAGNNQNTGNMMISTTGEVINQQQIFKIVSADGTTSNMIIDATNQSANSATTTSKVLLSNLTVLSKQQANTQGQIIGNSHQQPQNAGQTINFVNAKNLYTTSTANNNMACGGKQQKFTVATANVGNYKGSAVKQTSSTNAQYLPQPNTVGQQKINITGSRNMQMMTSRVQNTTNSNNTSNVTNNNTISVISNSTASAQTMILQQQSQKFITNNMAGSKLTAATLGSNGGNVMKKSVSSGTLRMNNSHNTSAAKLMNNLQAPQGVKTFITQTPSAQQQAQQSINQLSLQQHTTKGGSKSKFVKQYNNAILNSAGAVAIATLPHQQSNGQANLQIQQQQQNQQLQPQTTYINHHKNSGGTNKVNKINSKYAQSVNMAAQLPLGTHLHQKSINQSQQQQFQQTSNCNSNIKFVNAQGTVIQQQQQHQHHLQQQPLTSQKINNSKHIQQQYQNLQNFDTVDGNHLYSQANANQPTAVGMPSSISSGTTTLPLTSATGSSLLTDEIMMVNGTQMTDELSARILQSMSQKSFGNQRYQQQQQNVYQTKTSTTTPTPSSINSSSNNNFNSNNNMLPPPPCTAAQNTIVQTNNSNILLSPREYTLYPTTASASTVAVASTSHHSSPIHCNNSVTPTATASSNITAGSFTSNNYNTVSNNSNNITTITPHTSGTSVTNGTLCSNTSTGCTNTIRQVQSAPSSRSQSMERKLHESSMSRKSTEYYKVKFKDYHTGCAFVVPSAATIYTTNTSPPATSLIDFIIPLPSCTTITTTNNVTTSTNCATMTTIITNSSYNHKFNQINNNSNHNSLRGSNHHNNQSSATTAVAQTSGNLGMATNNISASVSNLTGGIAPTSTLPSPLPMPRPPSLPPAALIMEPQAQVIHLQATKTLPGANNSSNDDEDDIIGEEIRPAPLETEDIRLRILHAVLFDHTYVNPMPLELPTSFAVHLPTVSNSSSALISTTTPLGNTTTVNSQQWSLGGIGAISTGGNDSYSALTNSSGLAVGDIDPGEETETAAEAELEDDSVTRCICDLTHDDGYMICCDKCCAWQHVDCMGIDRQNIPDEYLCELCQPRIVDKVRARSLQLMKRKEQQQQLMLTTQAQASTSTGAMGTAGSASGCAANILPNDMLSAQQRLAASSGTGFNFTGNMSADSTALQLLAAGGANVKKNKMLKKTKDGVSSKRSKKAEKLAAAAAAGLAANNKPLRKETKKNTKRKKAGAHDGTSSTVGMTAAEKHAANLRQWIENYELAVTNHYSPELRARLHAICKQPSLLQNILNTENPILKDFSNGSLENRATTVPHAGGKILISKLDIVPNSPICELRGKYMLTTQYKTQNTSINMNSPPPNNYHLASYKAHKTPGPFIFFYQLPGTEIATPNQLVPQTTTTTTLNADGTYTTTTTTLPAQQSPPTFLKGPEICVDTRTYGNEARFVRRSCRPNAEIQHLFEKGTIHLFIVALTDIRASTEITIRHEPHDLLAVENKKSSTVIIQPTSTPCACGLIKDCVFGPPIAQLPPAAKSNAGRKSLAHGGGLSGNAGNLTAKQRKANQHNLNRNRSTSSSASGDSNMGGAGVATANAVTMNLNNSPDNMSKITAINKAINNNSLIPLTASCNSNLSNASSTSSTLTSMMHDSGVCTSSSSPSVSIPSPTQHLHSPIQQQQVPQQMLHTTQIRSAAQILPQQQQLQLMQSLPTPLVLSSPCITHLQQQQQQQSVSKPPVIITQQPQQQPSLSIIAQAATVLNPAAVHNINDNSEQNQLQISPCLSTQPGTEKPPQRHSMGSQLLQEQHQPPVQNQPTQHQTSVAIVPAGVLENISPDATIAAVALQSLNSSHSPNASLTTSSPVGCAIVEPQLHSPQIQQQQQFSIIPATEVTPEPIQQSSPSQHSQASENTTANTSATSISSPQQTQHQSPPQHKSPQKNTHSQNNMSTNPGRKTPGKHGRTTSFSEDNEHHHNEENSITSTPTYSSTPKEKPKLSREDRKMEAILRAIEKMERNQQKQKQSKRQNASSQNTTPTSPNKTFDSGENSGGTKRSNSHIGTAGRSKKKRKGGAKGGQGGANMNQRKQRQSRMNSQESVEDCNQQDHDAITSESDGCAATHSPTIQTTAPSAQPYISTPTSSSVTGSIAAAVQQSTETTNNVDQAAGLLMAFANPNVSTSVNACPVQIAEQQTPHQSPQQSPQRPSSQYMMPTIETTAASPPTTPSRVSSACLLIEAAVGPLESNLDSHNSEIHSSEFKYPLQAKTKKHLMNNWLHQAEDNGPADNIASSLTGQTSQPLQLPPVTSVVSSDVAGVSVVTGGLHSLLQAAMSDLKQSQSDSEQPQNLSIVAQKVEEFIQQTEASACGVQTKHSYEYEQHQQEPQRSYINLPTPAVDLTLKTPLTIGSNLSAEMTNNSQHFHSPLQVSTCSNNSSVKKRWLRQAISEETHEEFQHAFSMTPSPATGAVINTFSSSTTQPTANCLPAATITNNYVPNGFTTPLKKRRLLLTEKDEVEETVSQNCGDLCCKLTPSSEPSLATPQLQQQYTRLEQSEPVSQEFENKQTPLVDPSPRDMHEDVDVDVEKCEINEKQMQHAQDMTLKSQFQQEDVQYSKMEIMDQEQDVDVMTSAQEDAPPLVDHSKMVVKEEFSEKSAPQTDQAGSMEFNDQDDDVDILRSPSPGREMIKAEDNLVKIEPEDVSGMEDVKIDVELEESMAADDDVVTQHKEKKEEVLPEVHEKDNQTILQPAASRVEVKNEFKFEDLKDMDVKQKENLNQNVEVLKSNTVINEIKGENKSNEECEEPKSKRIKLENNECEEQKIVCVKKELTVEESTNVKPEISPKMKIIKKLENVSHSANEEEGGNTVNPDATRKVVQPTTINNTVGILASSNSSEFIAVKSESVDTTLDDVGSATPPLLSTANVPATAAPIQRQKSLSDDDIQARLHSFHKENILFLQSRNKKTKSSSSLTSNSNSNSASNNCLADNNDHHKSRNSSTSSSSHQHHHNHHHHYNYHEVKQKSAKSNLKHHKSSSSSTPSGTAKKQKSSHKRERTASSSSSSGHKILSTPSSVNKNSVPNSSLNSSESSKKFKSLKKSSSGSSTSSNASLSSYSSSTTALQNCVTTTSLNLEKEKVLDKDKHHRQRTTSSSANNISSSSSHVTPTAPFPSNKRRQLNFELELTKDMHLINSVTTGASKHKKEISRLLSDDQGQLSAKKMKKEKDELKNSTSKHVKTEKQHDKKSSSTCGNTFTKQPAVFNSPANFQPVITPVITPVTTTITTTAIEEPKFIPTIISQPQQPLLTNVPIVRDHPAIPQFNNVVLGPCSSSTSHQQQPPKPLMTPLQYQSLSPAVSLNIPTVIPSNSNSQQQQALLPTAPSPPGCTSSSSLSNQNVNSTGHLPFYNTIYGKLLDNPTLPITSTTSTPSPPITAAGATMQSGGSALSEYLDTKLKSYNTLGGYVSHTALFGLNNTAAIKDPPASPGVVSSLAASPVKEPSNEITVPLHPPSNVSSSSAISSTAGNSAAAITPMKIHTKTERHDPRLNPQLTAPEPPPQPKRKLSINEYRKRMKQSSSNDSNSSSGSLAVTPTTPPTSLESSSLSSLLGPMTMSLTNKCTLNSPDRLTQTVDSQIQKEIMSTNSTVTTSSSSLDSLNSSNSSTSLNDTPLKSSSFVEEDSTKGQFNAAPTLLEKAQESLCARLKSLKEKQSLGNSFGVASGNRSRFSSFSESVVSSDFGLKKEDEEMDIIRNRNLSISSSIGGGDLLDNCLEEISSTSTSMSSSREPSPDRCYTTTHHKILTASATTTVANTSVTSHSSNGQTTRHNINCDKSEMTSLECKKSVDIA